MFPSPNNLTRFETNISCPTVEPFEYEQPPDIFVVSLGTKDEQNTVCLSNPENTNQTIIKVAEYSSDLAQKMFLFCLEAPPPRAFINLTKKGPFACKTLLNN